jgi:hypothetical protein
MKKRGLRWKTLVPLAVVAAGLSVLASTSLASNKAGVVRVAIMTDCKGAVHRRPSPRGPAASRPIRRSPLPG